MLRLTQRFMAFAILQKELVVPDVEQLKRAFSTWPALTDLDAYTTVNDAYGILLRGLEPQQAKAMQEALRKENVETEVVKESDLPAIPPARIVRRVEFGQSHLTLYDPMGRASTLPWSDIMFIAAGLVRTREARKAKTALEEPQFYGVGISSDSVGGLRPRDDSHDRLLIEIFRTNGADRYSISAEEFAFDHLGKRLSDDPSINFVFLIQDLARNAPHAGLNRGAYRACQKPPELFAYPSKPTFNEELTWMLWRIGVMIKGQSPARSAS